MKSLISKIILSITCIFSIPAHTHINGVMIYGDIKYLNYIKPIKIKKVNRVPHKIVIGMIQVESNGNDSAYNKFEDAVGCLQIRPIMVREVNRILKKKGEKYRFKMKDRWNREKSLEMFWVWKDYHHSNSTDEVIARNWNGGPNGYNKKSTEKYWEKVSISLEGK